MDDRIVIPALGAKYNDMILEEMWGRPNIFSIHTYIRTHCTGRHVKIFAVCILKEDNISGDSGRCPGHGGRHDKTSAVAKENETGSWLDPHTARYVYIYSHVIPHNVTLYDCILYICL